jgi:hypothetical protein
MICLGYLTKGLYLIYLHLLFIPKHLVYMFFKKILQIHSHRHTITMHQQTRRQTLTQNLQITDIRQTRRLVQTRALNRRRKRGEHDCRVAAALARHKFVEYQMLCLAGEIVEGEWLCRLAWVARCS